MFVKSIYGGHHGTVITPRNAQCFENLAENGEWSFFTLEYIAFRCYMRNTA